MNVRLPAPCVQIHVPLVLENPSTGMKCMIDIPIYVMNSDNEQALLGMDVLSLGDFSASHQVDGKGRLWMEFQFNILDPSFSL